MKTDKSTHLTVDSEDVEGSQKARQCFTEEPTAESNGDLALDLADLTS